MKKLIFLIILFASLASIAQVQVNEICPNNVHILLDEDGDNEDWFELYNNSDSVVDITGWFISDKQNGLTKWTVPNIILQAKEYLVIFASGKDRKHRVNHWESILKAEDLWYLYSENPPPNANWNQPGFDYSPWWKTAGPFGRNYPNIQTYTANAATIYISKYFSITDTSIIDYARLYMDYDDAFVAYLNGVEIARSNIGGVSLQPLHTDISFDVHESIVNQGEIPEEFKISNDVLKEILIEGNNLLSIQIHNAWNNHGDCIAAPYLFLSFSDTVVHYDTVPTWFPEQNYFLHTNFKLSTGIEGVILSDPDTNIISARFFPTIKIDNSYICKNDTSMDWYITDTPTPQYSNTSSSIYSAYASKVILSQAAGFYPTSIQLGISTYYPNDSIFYTLDGSDPTKSSNFYSLPISIDSTMVVRARAYSDSLLLGPITTATYFINENKDFPVISLVTSPENLWDSLTGIYVLGSNADSIYPYDGANYWKDWERPAHIEFYDENGQEIFEQDIGIKIHGKMSRVFPMKSIRILARERYGKTHINCQVFPSKEVYSYKRLILRNSGHDFNRTNFRDAFAHKLVQEKTEIDIQDARAVVTYINGE